MQKHNDNPGDPFLNEQGKNQEINWSELQGSISGRIPDEVYNNLPRLLGNACTQFKDPVEKDVFFIGSIGVLSGCFPNYIGHYDGNWVSPQLYSYVIAPYGCGKGSMIYARQLGESIHAAKIKRTNEAMETYRQAMKIKKKNKDKDALPVPPQEMLFIPANSSKTALIEALGNNKGCGIIFETEGDTLADILKQDYATFSDVLRKAFHHEPISYLRRQDKEHVEINKPRLAFSLSSTYDQLLSLIPTIENGLFSRILFYHLVPNKLFRDVFSKDKENYESYFKSMGENIETKYNYLTALDKPITFHLTKEQEQKFLHHFGEEKEKINDDLHGTVNRLGLICYRLAMVFAMLRIYEYVDDPVEKVICKDVDFNSALQIVIALKVNAVRVYEYLSQNKVNKVDKKTKRLPEDLVRFYAALPEEFTTAEGLNVAKDNQINERRAERFFQDHFNKISHGKYAKIKSSEPGETSEMSVLSV